MKIAKIVLIIQYSVASHAFRFSPIARWYAIVNQEHYFDLFVFEMILFLLYF